MNKTAVQSLEYDKIMERLEQYAISDKGKESVGNLGPSIDIRVIRGWMEETSETRAILDKSSNVPLNSMDRTGIVCELENSKGEVGVMVMKKKVKVNRKRRKMEHRHVDGLVIEQNKG